MSYDKYSLLGGKDPRASVSWDDFGSFRLLGSNWKGLFDLEKDDELHGDSKSYKSGGGRKQRSMGRSS